MVNIPKTRRTHCTVDNAHTVHKVTQCKSGARRDTALGQRRYVRKQRGFGGQTKPVQHNKAKTTKKILLRLECSKCKHRHFVVLKRAKHFELGAERKQKKSAIILG
ncbi:Ribosomal protein L44e [Carpediemonas membranifera]|uniref:Ribosomal protein L44e n=1 Tax=Carpediemonas membranifera TaxID=201153 RepID=A0A8J6E2F2_9EUKA|nr:Ribosomal protein L44e [Carpediemonas membranifera]KAG9394256.1 Ribosomal protein L44e [Carpediemonas membranifera]KAG9395989.1 Ribosomal protein L44e [Carpediemonas membranifera]|eukprot:KAG9393782.1 Ribosomal protein L44e [Carpediemonas membranifera]